MARKKTGKNVTQLITRKAVPKKSVNRKANMPTFKKSSRQIYDIPLNVINCNPGNPGGYRDREVIPILFQQGFRIFPSTDTASDRVLWTMLNGEPGKPPNDQLRSMAVELIKDHEPQLMDMAESIEGVGLIHPIHIVLRKKQIGIESGLVRALCRSLRYAIAGKPPGVIEAELENTSNEAMIQARAAVENMHFIATNPMAIAFRLKIMLDSKMAIEDVATRIGKSIQTVKNYLDLCDMPEDVKEAVASGDMTMQNAREMAKISRQTGEDLEDIADEMSPTRNTKQKRPKKRRKVLAWDKVFGIYESQTKPKDVDLQQLTKAQLIESVYQQYDNTISVLLDILQLEPEEAAKIAFERMASDIEFDASDFVN